MPERPCAVGWMPFDLRRASSLFGTEQQQQQHYDPRGLTARQTQELSREVAQADGPDLRDKFVAFTLWHSAQLTSCPSTGTQAPSGNESAKVHS